MTFQSIHVVDLPYLFMGGPFGGRFYFKIIFLKPLTYNYDKLFVSIENVLSCHSSLLAETGS